jgi:dTDP-4-dehydrorhamnose 3,5-epimerase-like enzyme
MQLKERIIIIKRNLITDSRGFFLKVLTGTEEGLPDKTGEVYVTMAKSSESRGGHYHSLATEYFTIIQGKATLILEDINTHELSKLLLDSENPCTVIVPPFVAHLFKNISENEFLLLAYSDKIYDPKDTIIYQINDKA